MEDLADLVGFQVGLFDHITPFHNFGVHKGAPVFGSTRIGNRAAGNDFFLKLRIAQQFLYVGH